MSVYTELIEKLEGRLANREGSLRYWKRLNDKEAKDFYKGVIEETEQEIEFMNELLSKYGGNEEKQQKGTAKGKTKATMQAEIDSYKRIVNGQQDDIIELNKRIEQLQQGVDTQLKEGYQRALLDIERLKAHISQQEKYIKLLKDRKEGRIHNARGAGRKRSYTDDQASAAKEWRKAGKSYAEIAAIVGLSVGTVHKIINEHESNEK